MSIYYTGIKHILLALSLAFIGFIKGLNVIMIIGLAMALFLTFFFRNPKRIPLIATDKQIISPADGVVIKILKDVQLPVQFNDLEGQWQQVSIFMGVHDVHINRSPINGVVRKCVAIKGSFKYARADQADSDNERVAILIENSSMGVVCQQVAGMLARRIICHIKEGDLLKAGSIYGIIQLGSRADLFIPNDLKVCVQKGQKVKAGLDFIVQ